MMGKLLKISILSSLIIFSFTYAHAQDLNLDEGKTTFKNYCASCHNKNMKDKSTGPALAGFEERWADYPREDLYSWIRNSQALIASGHPRANELWSEWVPSVMTSFPALKDDQIENIVGYINFVVDNPVTNNNLGPDGPNSRTAVSDNSTIYYILAAVLALLAIILARIISNLSYITQVKAGTAPAQRRTLVDILTSRLVMGTLILALILIGGYTFVNKAIELGRQQDYKPEQPIAFSHKLHAGDQKIECQYCHDGARRSKHALIPTTSTCMNCHSAVKVGRKTSTKEITKIYASIGFDPNTGKYIDDYESLSDEEVKEIYTKWIGDNYVEENKILDSAGEAIMESQWEGIITALTDPASGDKKIAGPIEWKRIHNLPDHVYFNHSQHVEVGGVECQSCHGEVESMEIVHQHAPLSMGWCINCHRKTEVKFADNQYYESYELYHKQIENGERKAVTVEDIGGLECQKCHY